MKKTVLFLAAILCSSGLFAMASDCPAEAEKCTKEMKEKCAKQNCKDNKKCPEARCPRKKQIKKHNAKNWKHNAPQARHPRFKMSPEAKAEFEKFRNAVNEYKANKTPENKAKVTAFLSKNFDKQIEMNKKRAESMRKFADGIEKKNAEMLKNRDAEIEKIFQRIMNPPKRAPRKAPAAKKAPDAKPAA